MSQNLDTPGFVTRVFRFAIACVTGFLLFLLVSIYLPWQEQLTLGIATVVVGLIVNRFSSSRVITIALMMISSTATLRYFWWRVHMLVDYFTDESNNRGVIDTTFILILLTAEAYTVVIMFLGYMQTAWPLARKPVPLPADESSWPHVDLLIPTYNEPLSLVRYTALAALAIDYPPEKLHVYILDDGTREDFKQFCKEANVGYVTRVKHDHAKAGNINHALTRMNSEYVAIFDCDHVPTRSFLQMTMGWMLADKKLAMMQTPHHFYSPDPFERNLLQYKTIPNEGELFYGIVQDGNDFWNATFFCGSCALLRRSILNEVGGIAVETVTEDAHTSLRMQKLGYNTAYMNVPQAAGLATETLAAHVGQRIRWARGMIQILRTDNPLLGRKMKFSQRLCYFNAMAHFLYAVPRLVFLLAPLVYLLMGRTIIPGYWAAILVYAMPHLILSNLTNSRVQGSHRHSFWNEIYETVLAPYILAPTVLALINPKLGKFNVTDKGNTLAQTKFDHSISRPTKFILLLNLVGMLTALYLLFIRGTIHTGAVVMNLIWVVFNMVILGVAAAVAYEQKQRRTSVRVEAKLPVSVRMRDGTPNSRHDHRHVRRWSFNSISSWSPVRQR
jgi:cellulose synthase (UDP-forming)